MEYRFLKFLFLVFIMIGCQKKDEIVKRDHEPDIYVLKVETLK